MDLEQVLQDNSSRLMVDYIVEQILTKPALFEDVYRIAMSSDSKHAWKAAWVMSHLIDRDTSLFEDKYSEIMNCLPKVKSDGVKRSFIYILSRSSLKEYSVEFINQCFEWLISPQQPIAVQVYSMQALWTVCKQIPELKPEFQVSLENVEPSDYSKGFVAARKKMLKLLNKNK